MSGTDVSLTDLLLQAMQQAMESQNGPMLGQVNTYDPATRRANVTPLVPLYVEPGDEPLPPPAIPHVLVVWPEGPSHAITWPLGAGATVILEPLGHDHTAWITSGTANQPSRTRRRFALADVVAVPLAARPNTNPPPVTSYDSAWGVLFGQWAAGGSDATDFVALASLVKAELDKIQLAHDTHNHPTAPVGPVSVPSVLIGSIGNVAATHLKAK